MAPKLISGGLVLFAIAALPSAVLSVSGAENTTNCSRFVVRDECEFIIDGMNTTDTTAPISQNQTSTSGHVYKACRWMPEHSICIKDSCAAASANETACALLAPSCEYEYDSAKLRCKIANRCRRATNATACGDVGTYLGDPSLPLCTWTNTSHPYKNNTANNNNNNNNSTEDMYDHNNATINSTGPAPHPPPPADEEDAPHCRVACEHADGNETACLELWGGLCGYNRTSLECFPAQMMPPPPPPQPSGDGTQMPPPPPHPSGNGTQMPPPQPSGNGTQMPPPQPSGNGTQMPPPQPSGNGTQMPPPPPPTKPGEEPPRNSTNNNSTTNPTRNEGNMTNAPRTTLPPPPPPPSGSSTQRPTNLPPPPQQPLRRCDPDRKPIVVIESTVNTTSGLSLAAPYQRTNWIRLTADFLRPYLVHCSDNTTVDLAPFVQLTWGVYNAPPPPPTTTTTATTTPAPTSTTAASNNVTNNNTGTNDKNSGFSSNSNGGSEQSQPPLQLGALVRLPPTALTVGPVLAIPPYTLGDGDKMIVLNLTLAIPNGGLGPNTNTTSNEIKRHTIAFRIRLAPLPNPRVVQQGGMIEVGRSQSFYLLAVVRVPCNNATDAEQNCAKSDDGLKPYVCGAGAGVADGASCPESAGFSWLCEGIACGDVLAAAFRRRFTTYPNVSIGAEGLYNITAVYRYTREGTIRVASDSRVIRVVTNATIPLSLTCSPMLYRGQNGTCTAIIGDRTSGNSERQSRLFRWSVNGSVMVGTTFSGSSIIVRPDAVSTPIAVSLIDEQLGTVLATASNEIPPAAWVEVVCRTTSVSLAGNTTFPNVSSTLLNVTGLNSTITVRCDVITKSPSSDFLDNRAPRITYSFRTRGQSNATEMALVTAPIPLVSSVLPNTTQKTLSNTFTFAAPPTHGMFEVIARVSEGLGGRPIVFGVVPQALAVQYVYTAGAARELKDRIEEGRQSGDINSVAAAASQLAQASRGGSARPTEVRDVALTVIGALSNVTSSASASSLAALPDTTAKTVVDALLGAVLDTSVKAVPPPASGGAPPTRTFVSSLSGEDKEKAAQVLTSLARQAISGASDNAGFVDTMLSAAEALADVKDVARNVSNDVLSYLLGKATAGGPAVTVGSGSLRVSVSSYAATDNTAKATTDESANAVGLPSGFSFFGGDSSSSSFNPNQVASLSMTTIPSSDRANETSTPPNAGEKFASPVTILNIYIDGQKAQVANRTSTPVFIRLSLSAAARAQLANSSSSSGGGGLVVRYWDEASQMWQDAGITTLAKCSNYAGSAVTSTAAQDATHVCAFTTHFTSFAVFDDPNANSDGKASAIGIIVGAVVGGVIGLAILIAIVVFIVRSKKNKVAPDELDSSERYAQNEHPNKLTSEV